jgi:predicted glycoside hydrolase/deacetylase ChbG (UPF0249 family)
MTARLIVNADDLGLSAGVNQGILEAHQRGIVTSTTAMVNLPAAAAGIARLQNAAPQMGIGLHFNLTHGRPVLPPEQVPSLVQPDGRFYPVQAVYSGELHFAPAEITAELNAQFERFMALAGCLPDHLDSHHNVTYTIPAALATLLDLAQTHALPLRRGRWPAEDAALAAVWARYAPPRWPQATIGRFNGQHEPLATLLSILDELPADSLSELVCHPGYAYDVDEAYSAPREAELAALTDPSVSARAQAAGVELVTFAALAAER